MPQKKFKVTNDTNAFLRIREKAAKELIERLNESRDDLNLVVLDGLDAAIVGSTEIEGQTHLIYDRFRITQIFVNRDGMGADEAEEYCEYNVEGAHYGQGSPIFADVIV